MKWAQFLPALLWDRVEQLCPVRLLSRTALLGLAAVAFLVGQGEDIECSPCWSLHRETGSAQAGGSGEKGCSVDKVIGVCSLEGNLPKPFSSNCGDYLKISNKGGHRRKGEYIFKGSQIL